MATDFSEQSTRRCSTAATGRDRSIREYELGRLQIEDRFGEAVINDLRARGHIISVMESWSLGRVCAVERRGGLFYAGATPWHMQSYAVAR
jgi:gamma-glutamyltranspeptidase/glutathione hydrolase